MNPRIHFHSLDALRFFAFLKVYLLHLPIQGDFPIFGYLKSGGGVGVIFFFVLSGFLITYLLIHDKINRGQISIPNFFMRRSFRIWPLFYLMIILAFVLPFTFRQDIGMHMVGGGYIPDWKFSFTFTENYNMLLQDNFPRTTPLPVFWSLCIEEHFYIVWMLVAFILPIKHFLKFLLGCFLLAWIARYFEPSIFHNQTITNNDLFTNIDYFASGGLLGYFVAKNYAKVSVIVNSISFYLKWIFIFIVISIVVFQKELLFPSYISRFDVIRPTILGLLFAGLIAIFIPSDSRIRIKSKILSYLGTISFGLYVFHILCIHLMFQLCLNQKIVLDNWASVSVFIMLNFGITVLISSISYKYFEKPFLRMRERLSLKKE